MLVSVGSAFRANSKRPGDIVPEQSAKMFIVQDRLFRVWGKLTLEREDGNVCYGSFEPMPDFAYLKGKFTEYEQLLDSDFENMTQVGELNKWMVELRPKLISSEGRELDLLSAHVRSLERPPKLVFYGIKLSTDDQQTYRFDS